MRGDSAVVLGVSQGKEVSGGKPFEARFKFTDASPEGLVAGESDQIRLRKKAAEIFTRL